MNARQRRERLRRLLAGQACVSPASVHDPLSARLAESAGFELGLFSGSIASAVLLAAPDLILHTLSELADHVRRILRASTLSLIVDADNGFGNALAVMRTVEELEHAGVAMLSVEDTVGPAFSSGAPEAELVSLDEAVGKYRAAVAARSDATLAIAARTRVLTAEGIDRAIVRVKAYAAAGVDVIWTPRIDSLEEVKAIREAAGLPVVVGSKHGNFSRDELAECGVRIALQGHMPIAAAIKAMRDTYVHLADPSKQPRPALASGAEMDRLLDGDAFQQRLEAYLRAPRT
ncbi:MAG TPA: isocitrate lyase/PEP mutase family protein [Dongiaceae bacterium]|nr:isocitrate lyase/PEP mutase family protein [Dongiaceae bacterium]